jgi:hypothetical protein
MAGQMSPLFAPQQIVWMIIHKEQRRNKCSPTNLEKSGEQTIYLLTGKLQARDAGSITTK